MRIALHDEDKAHFKKKVFPNLALMKISAWHKKRGDSVEWWNPLLQYDKVYSSKIFDFTPKDPYLPEDTIRGGTGYTDIPVDTVLPEEIDRMFPDYSTNVYLFCHRLSSHGDARITVAGVLCHKKRGVSSHTGNGKKLSGKIRTNWS